MSRSARSFLVACAFAVSLGGSAVGFGDEGLPDPAGADSHASFLSYMRSNDERLFRRLLARYDAYVIENPDEVAPQVERCRFIENASCDEAGDCPYWKEFEACRAALAARFPNAPDVLLFQLEQLWGEEAIAHATKLVDRPGWSDRQRASLHRALAQQHGFASNHAETLRHAERAMTLDDELDLTLLAAEALEALDRKDAAIAMASRRAATGSYWEDIQRVDLLERLGAGPAAAELLAALEPPEGYDYQRLLRARVWLGVGEIERARAVLDQAEANPIATGSAADVQAARFELELSHGDRDSAIAYYEKLRDGGFASDPFLKRRLELAWAYPFAPWQLRDLLGLLAIAGVVLFLALLPAVVILPVHYIGLVRARMRPSSRRDGRCGTRGTASPSSSSRRSRSSTWMVSRCWKTRQPRCRVCCAPAARRRRSRRNPWRSAECSGWFSR